MNPKNYLSPRIQQNILVGLVLFSAVLVCYSAVVNAGFVWDDEFLIERNPLLRAPLWAMQMFSQDIVNSGFTYTNYYRPLQMLSYAFDYRIGGLDPAVFHVTNIILHFLNSLVAFCLVQNLTGRRPVALLTGFIFAVNPLQVGSVSYISGRADLLFFLFGFLSLWSFAVFRRRKDHVYLVAAAFFLCASFFSKEAALAFPFLCLFMDLVFFRREYGFNPLYHVPNFTVMGAWALIHRAVSGGGYGFLFTGWENIAEGALNALKIGADLLVLGIIPYSLGMRRSLLRAGEYWPLALILLAAASAALLLLRDRRRILVFSAGFSVIALIPFLVASGPFNVYAEHWMYVPGFGIFLFISSVAVRLYSSARVLGKTLIFLLLYAVFVLYPARTLMQNRYWIDDASLSEQVLDRSGRDLTALHYKAVSLLESGKKIKSLDAIRNITQDHFENARAWYLRGRLFLAAGRIEEAETDFGKALELHPDYDNAYFGLALASLAENREKEGMEYISRTLQINPKHPEAIRFLTMAFSRSGDPEKALRVAEMARDTYPYDYRIQMSLARAYTRLGKLQEAAMVYLDVVKLYPAEPAPYYELGYIFYKSGLNEDALNWLKKAVMADADYKPAKELIRKIYTGQNV
ncbi:MAG: tetratricopeptide repeat protein [Candidatus Omnitrophica bacterium]|nr:tetratricopeptide repeat protein [Candidatus Omnitrophota bacterium]